METKECYRVLGLAQDATRAEIVATYRALLRKWHPDRIASSGDKALIDEANRKCQLIIEAYRGLKNHIPRKQDEPSNPSTRTSQTTSPKSQASRSAQTSPPRAKTANSHSDYQSNTSENHARRSETSRPKQEETKRQPEPTPATPPQPNTTPKRKAAAPSLELRFWQILLGAMSLTLIFALIIFKVSNQQTNELQVSSPQIQQHAPVLANDDPSQHVPTGKKEQPPSETALPGAISIIANRSDAKIEITQSGGISANIGQIPTSTGSNGHERSAGQLPPGEYLVTARLAGWQDVLQNVTVKAGQTSRVVVEFKRGSLRLESDPTGADVLVQGKKIGKTPLVLRDLPVGTMTFALQYDSWPESSATAEISEGAETAKAVRLPRGQLTIESTPAGASVLIDGQEKGRTPLVLKLLPTGNRLIQLQATNYETYEASVAIADGSALRIHPVLASNLPAFEPKDLLQQVWATTQRTGKDYDIAPAFDRSNSFRPRNGVIKNLDRQKLFSNWLGRPFRYRGTVKQFEAKSGEIEFVEGSAEKSKYRILALISSQGRANRDLINRLLKGAEIEITGRLTAAEEPRWPSKIITFEISDVDLLQ